MMATSFCLLHHLEFGLEFYEQNLILKILE